MKRNTALVRLEEVPVWLLYHRSPGSRGTHGALQTKQMYYTGH
jgi:hypothetical protein